MENLMTLKQVMDCVHMTKSTIYRYINKGEFPSPVKMDSTNPASAPNNDKLYQIAGTIRNTNPEYFQGQMFCYGIGENTRMAVTGQCIYKNNSGYTHNEAFSSSSDTTQTINGMKFQMSSGNINGTISLYGITT